LGLKGFVVVVSISSFRIIQDGQLYLFMKPP